MELGLGPGKSWKVNQMVTALLTRVHVFGIYIRCRCPIDNCPIMWIWRKMEKISWTANVSDSEVRIESMKIAVSSAR